jgi:hypothetical protein
MSIMISEPLCQSQKRRKDLCYQPAAHSAFELTSEALAARAGCECKAGVSLVDVTGLPDGLVHPASRDAHETIGLLGVFACHSSLATRHWS